MTFYDWQSFMTRWNAEMLQSKWSSTLPAEVVARRWLGFPGATEEQIGATEQRLGVVLPPSYRAFLAFSNGWHRLNSFITRVLSVDEIEWLATRQPKTIEDWKGDPDDYDGPTPIADEDYLTYPDKGARFFRVEYLQDTLEISDEWDGILLLNAAVIHSDGEWEAWFLAHWIPGANRYRSFWDLMQAEYQRFVKMKD